MLAKTVYQFIDQANGPPPSRASPLPDFDRAPFLHRAGLYSGVTSADDLHRFIPPTESIDMSKKPSKHGPNKAKSIIAQPLFRSRQERAGKGKGSYRREAFQSNSWEASYFLAA